MNSSRLRQFLKFLEYGCLLDYRNIFLVGTFEEVIKDYWAVISNLNKCWSTGFLPFEVDYVHLELVKEEVEQVARSFGQGESQAAMPSSHRTELKRALRNQLSWEKGLVKDPLEWYKRCIQYSGWDI
jgi:hypothetical protein